MWKSEFETFEVFDDSLRSTKGRQRTPQENKMILLVLKAYLNRRIKANDWQTVSNINWTSIEEEVASDLRVKRIYITNL